LAWFRWKRTTDRECRTANHAGIWTSDTL